MVRPATEKLGRQKSTLPFSRASLSGLIPLNTNGIDDGEKSERKTGKRGSMFHLGSSGNAESVEDGSLSPLSEDRSVSPQLRPRISQRNRPASLLGSLGRKSGSLLRERLAEHRDNTPGSAISDSYDTLSPQGTGQNVLHHGEVQTTSGLFRKKKEYLVLTESHLIRFKSVSRAIEVFPSISLSRGRYSGGRHASTTSIGSLQDMQSIHSHSSIEGDSSIPLSQIVTAYKVEDGRPFFTTEVVHLDEESNIVGSIQLMLQDPRDADLWHTSIRGAAQKARLLSNQPYADRVVDYLVNELENVLDYDESRFQIFRVVRRASSKSTGRSSSDDLAKLGSSAFYLVIGINRLHLISLPDFNETLGRFTDVKSSKSSFGLVTLVTMKVQHADDAFELGFRNPLQPLVILDLAAFSAPEICTMIFKSILFLKPQWLDYTFLFSGPPGILDDSGAPLPSEEDNGNFDRTLVAYCLAYGCDPSNVRYSVDPEVEDGPEFQLFPPAEPRNYTVLELLAIFRALRYNESFRSISFNGINLQNLHGLIDHYGTDHVAWTTRSGLLLRDYSNILPEGKSVLYQEVQAIALKTKRARRLNFGDTLPLRRPRDTYDDDTARKDPACDILAALLPLCRGQFTNVDWIVFSGIELGETDLDELILALDEKRSHFRCIDVSRCGLSDRGIQIFLNHLERQNATMECINISDNPGRIHLGQFPITMSRFSQIRKLDLSRVTSTSGEEPLIATEVMLAWRLEELIINGVPVNDKTLDAIATYVASEMSGSLTLLQMDQCHLTGAQVAVLMRSMSHKPGEARNMHLHVSANRLEKGSSEIVTAIEENLGPSYLTMRMVEYQTESRFRQLLQALCKNTTIKYLDISKASLPYDAGDDTCAALQLLFQDNITLEELNISGEHAHLEVARFGIGLNSALTGLKKNKALKILKIEYQNLGLEGANTLSSVLEENQTLTHIFCEHNEINLQGFTTLVNALANNFNLVYLPEMTDDRNESVKKLKSAVHEARATSPSKPKDVKTTVRKTLNSLVLHSSKETSVPTANDLEQAVLALESRWTRQAERMKDFLARNTRIAEGIETRSLHEGSSHPDLRPVTAESELGILDSVLSSSTPQGERGDPFDSRSEETTQSQEKDIKLATESSVGTRARSLSQLTAKIGRFELGDETLETDE